MNSFFRGREESVELKSVKTLKPVDGGYVGRAATTDLRAVEGVSCDVEPL